MLVSSVLGAAGGILTIVLKGRDKTVPMPYGPWLAGAGGIALFFGPAINAMYLR